MSKVHKLVTEQDLKEVDHSRRVVKKEFLDQLIVKIKGRDISKQEEQWTEALEKETIVMCPSKVIWECLFPLPWNTCMLFQELTILNPPMDDFLDCPPPHPTPPTILAEMWKFQFCFLSGF